MWSLNSQELYVPLTEHARHHPLLKKLSSSSFFFNLLVSIFAPCRMSLLENKAKRPTPRMAEQGWKV